MRRIIAAVGTTLFLLRWMFVGYLAWGFIYRILQPSWWAILWAILLAYWLIGYPYLIRRSRNGHHWYSSALHPYAGTQAGTTWGSYAHARAQADPDAQATREGSRVVGRRHSLPVVREEFPILGHRKARMFVDHNGKPWFIGVTTMGRPFDAGVFRARCNHLPILPNFLHRVPNEPCDCGIYAWPADQTGHGGYEGVRLQVELGGMTLECDTGYRASHQVVREASVASCPRCGAAPIGLWLPRRSSLTTYWSTYRDGKLHYPCDHHRGTFVDDYWRWHRETDHPLTYFTLGDLSDRFGIPFTTHKHPFA